MSFLKDDYLLRVDVHPYFLSKLFNLDIANEAANMKGNDSLYAGLTVKGIAAESFVHGLGYYGTGKFKQLHPEIASVNYSSGVIDIASTDYQIGRFQAIWDSISYTQANRLFNVCIRGLNPSP